MRRTWAIQRYLTKFKTQWISYRCERASGDREAHANGISLFQLGGAALFQPTVFSQLWDTCPFPTSTASVSYKSGWTVISIFWLHAHLFILATTKSLVLSLRQEQKDLSRANVILRRQGCNPAPKCFLNKKKKSTPAVKKSFVSHYMP